MAQLVAYFASHQRKFARAHARTHTEKRSFQFNSSSSGGAQVRQLKQPTFLDSIEALLHITRLCLMIHEIKSSLLAATVDAQF